MPANQRYRYHRDFQTQSQLDGCLRTGDAKMRRKGGQVQAGQQRKTEKQNVCGKKYTKESVFMNQEKRLESVLSHALPFFKLCLVR